MNKLLLTATAASAFVAVAAPAQTIYTDRAAFEAAISGIVIDDFEENDTGGFTPYGTTYVGDTFTVEGGNLFTVDPAFDPVVYEWNSGDVLDLEFDDATITVAPGITALGFDFGVPDFFPGNGVVTINGDDYVLIGQPTFNFFGIVDTVPIATISLNGGLGVIDNVTTGTGTANPVVPEPASWAMMIAGFGLVGGALRRRQVRVAIA